MKKLAALGFSLAGYLSLAFPAFADNKGVKDICPGGGFEGLCKLTSANFGSTVGVLIQIAFVLAVIIALGFLIFGGIKWITSGGDKTGVEGARNTIVASIVGLVIVFLAFFIINIVLGFFNLNINKLEIPSLPRTSTKCVTHNKSCDIGGVPCCRKSDSCTRIAGGPPDAGKCQ